MTAEIERELLTACERVLRAIEWSCTADRLDDDEKAAILKAAIAKANAAIKRPRVLVEVSGGVAEISTEGDVDTLLVDYDNGDDLPEEWEGMGLVLDLSADWHENDTATILEDDA